MVAKRVRLDYGERGLDVDLPDSAVVIEPQHVPGLDDEPARIVESLRRPIAGPALATLARGTRNAVIVFSDLTRPVPNARLLPPILEELRLAGLRNEQITLLNATGLHRPNTPAELESMLGRDVVTAYRVVNHDARDESSLVSVGSSAYGTDIVLNRIYVDADLRITTGFIEPHFFAGFSGGGKSLLPGIAGEVTVLRNHDVQRIGHPNARWGYTYGNPVFDENRLAASIAPPAFIVNVALNRQREVTRVFAGELRAAHDAGCEFVRSTAMQPVRQPFDAVVTTNSGYPLDINVYQAVKGMSAAAQIVRKGGDIVIAAECREGLGQPAFAEILRAGRSPRDWMELIGAPGYLKADQWEVQVLASILDHARVHIYSDRLDPADAADALLEPADSIDATVAELDYIGARIGVLPQGPLTIPYLTPD